MTALIEPGIFHRVVRARLRSLLVGLENALRATGKTEPGPLLSGSDGRLNIEHLLPQAWTKHWPLPEDADEAAVLKRQSALHRLGNLTLTTVKLNSSLSNNPWSHKVNDIKKHSLLRLTTDSVLTAPPAKLPEWAQGDRWAVTWDERRVEMRTFYLTSLALEQWSRPATDEAEE